MSVWQVVGALWIIAKLGSWLHSLTLVWIGNSHRCFLFAFGYPQDRAQDFATITTGFYFPVEISNTYFYTLVTVGAITRTFISYQLNLFHLYVESCLRMEYF